MKEKVIIYGTGSFGEVAYYYFTIESPYDVVAFTADKNYIVEKNKFGLPIVPFNEVQELYPPEKYKMFIAIAYSQVNRIRAKKYYEAKKKGYELITYIHPKAIVADNVEIGDNCFIFEANVIQPYVKIGNNVIIWSGNHIGHHTTIGNHVFIASHAVISGHCKIGDYSFIGVNTTFRDGITVARDCIIGAGALVVRDTERGGVYIGHPAKKIRTVYEKELKGWTENVEEIGKNIRT